MTQNPHTPPKGQQEDEQWLDEILLNFAKRIEFMPSGRTYDWQEEKAAIVTGLVPRELKNFVTWHNDKYDSSYDSGIPLEHISEYLKSGKPQPTPTNDSDEQLRYSNLGSLDSLYQPSISDLELNEHHGKDQPVVYLEAAKALFEILIAQARKGYRGEFDGSKLDSVQVADFCIAMSDLGVVVLPNEGAKVLAWHQSDVAAKVAEAEQHENELWTRVLNKFQASIEQEGKPLNTVALTTIEQARKLYRYEREQLTNPTQENK